jgi:hypothetical protein
MTVTQRLKECWLQSGSKIVPGATPEETEAFEERYGVSLPAEVRDYFAVVGGMEEGNTDDLVMEFFPLHAVTSVPEELGDWGGIPDYRRIVDTLDEAEHCFVFIDYMFRSHVYALRFSSDALERSPVVWICGAENAIIADSLTEFLGAYLADPYSILFPKQLYP